MDVKPWLARWLAEHPDSPLETVGDLQTILDRSEDDAKSNHMADRRRQPKQDQHLSGMRATTKS